MGFLLKNIGGVITAFTSLCFACAFFYNTAFLGVFDKELLFELTMSDHVTTAIFFLPKSTIMFLIGVFIGMLLLKESTDSNTDKKKVREKIFKYCATVARFFVEICVLLMIVFTVFVVDYRDPYVYFAIVILFGKFVVNFVLNQLSVENHSAVSTIILMLLFFLILSASSGYTDGVNKVTNPQKTLIYFQNGDEEEFNFVRKLNSVVILHKENKVFSISNNQIEKIVKPHAVIDRASVACKLSTKFCI